MLSTLPVFTQKYFWGDDLAQLNWNDHKKYITQILLDKGDVDTISWLFTQISKNDLKKVIPELKLSDKSRNFWETYLS
jgi:hypothetical protein